jgi:hypothetical protein
VHCVSSVSGEKIHDVLLGRTPTFVSKACALDRANALSCEVRVPSPIGLV